jgi:hypothetical protein
LIAATLSILDPPEIITHFPQDHISELVHSCLQWTSHDDISVSSGASQFISNLALLKVEYCDQVVQGILSHQNLDSELLDTTIKMRYLGIISEILATGKEEWFASCLRHGATDAILKACELSDILAQMVALEYLPSVMSCRLGLDYLTTGLVTESRPSISHIDWLLEASSERGDDYLRAQCLACTATLLSNLERSDHPFCKPSQSSSAPSRYSSSILPFFLSSLCNLLESSVETEKLSALSSLSLFATSSPSAFLNTLSYSNLFPTWISLLRSQPSLQAPTLHSIAQVLLYPYVLNPNQPSQSHPNIPLPILQHPPIRKDQLASSFLSLLSLHGQDTQESIVSILASFHPLKKALFDQIGSFVGKSSTVDYLVKLAKQPIAETKIGAVDVLRSLAYQDNIWGLQTLMGHVGFYNYIQVTPNALHSSFLSPATCSLPLLLLLLLLPFLLLSLP